jgi:hypothetical protein
MQEEMQRKLIEDEFTLGDFRDQMKQLRKLGPLESILGMMPQLGPLKDLKNAKIDEKEITRLVAIVGPMLNTTPPATVCSSNASCGIVAVNIADPAQTTSTPLLISSGAVLPKVGVGLSKSSVKKGRPTTFTGKVGPNQARQKVTLQRKSGKKWVAVKSARLDLGSRYTIRLRPKSRKDTYWRVLLPKTAFHKAATSKRKKLKVR